MRFPLFEQLYLKNILISSPDDVESAVTRPVARYLHGFQPRAVRLIVKILTGFDR
jgi:hypothetical protein